MRALLLLSLSLLAVGCEPGQFVITVGGSDAGVEAFDVDPRLDARRDGGARDAGRDAPVDAGSGARVSPHTVLGLPDDSAAGDATKWLVVKPQYALSFDATKRAPKWVAWKLVASSMGTAPRASTFKRDVDLPTTVTQAAAADYSGSGFVRGHMCPSEERTESIPDNEATFVYSNVVPQTAQLNGGPWKDLEYWERRWAMAGYTVFITSGPLYSTAPASFGNGVKVPTHTWKVLVALPPGVEPSAAAVTESTSVVAVIMPNTTTVSGTWELFRTSVDEVEQRTGLDLLSDVPAAVQTVVEGRIGVAPL